MNIIRKTISCLLILSLFISIIPISTMAITDDDLALSKTNVLQLQESADIDMEAIEEQDTFAEIDIKAGDQINPLIAEEFKEKKPKRAPDIIQNISKEDFLYGNSVLYHLLKKVGKLDLFKNKIDYVDQKVYEQESLNASQFEEEQPVVDEQMPANENLGKEEQPVVDEQIPANENLGEEEQPVVDEQIPANENLGEEEQPVVDEQMPANENLGEEEQPVVDEQIPANENLGEEEQPVVDEQVPSNENQGEEEQPVVDEQMPANENQGEEEQPVVDEQVPSNENQGEEEQPVVDEQVPPNANQYEEIQQIVDQEVYREEGLEEILGEDFIKLLTTVQADKDYYDTLVGPSATNNLNNTQYSAWKNTQEIISPETGDLTLKITDLSLPGRNGLDLNISRIYQSNQSRFGEKRVTGDLAYCYEDYSTYYLNRYNLGTGWMFGFPSVQVEKGWDTEELYYHVGDGTVYHVDFDAAYSYSNLEKYYKQDVLFDVDTSYSNGGVSSAYSFTTADQTKQYFASDGRLLAIVDRFGNEILFEHTEMPVTNRAPNNDFEYPEDDMDPYTMAWIAPWNSKYSYNSDFGKDDSSSIKFENNSAADTEGMFSKLIEVHPNTRYYLGGYLYDSLTQGTVSMRYWEHDEEGYIVGQGDWLTASEKNNWQHVEQFFTTGANTRYIRIFFQNTNAVGSSYFDKVVFDQAWPLISKITDSIGREIDFTYTNTLYEENPDESVNIVVHDPSGSESINLTYEKNYYFYNYTMHWQDDLGAGGDWTEQRKCPTLYSFSNGIDTNYYDYSIYPSSGNEYWSFFYRSPNDYSAWAHSPLLHEVALRNSEVYYNYEMKTNFLGDDGFAQTHRVCERYEKYALDTGWSDAQNRQQYSYNGTCDTYTYDNESGYPYSSISPKSSNFYFTCTMEQDNGLTIEQQLRGGIDLGLQNYLIRSILSTGEEKDIYYDYYTYSFPDLPALIRTVETTGSGSQTLYIRYYYNDWGGLASETRPLTQSQYDDPTIKAQNTISYTYDSNFKLLTSKSYYQDESTQLSLSNSYDSMGRLISTTNEKGETIAFSYDDSSHPGNLTETSIDLSGGRSSIVEYDYNDSSNTYAYPTSITQYYTENGNAQSSTTSTQYEYLFGNTISQQDGKGNQTGYQYDAIGRLTKVTYPPSTGEAGQYTIEDNYDYSLCHYPSELNGRAAMQGYYYRNKLVGGAPTTIQQQYSYYDDHGNLLLSKNYDYENSSYIVDQYNFNDYDQLTTYEDDQGNISSYVSDEWNRLQSITDTQGNQQLYEYDNYNRTNSICFVPLDTGVAENHYIKTYDQWGRTISEKGFPNGINQTPIETTYQYDLAGNLVASVDGRNNTTNYQYDQLNRLTQVTDALGQNTDYSYDRLGGLSSSTQYEGIEEFITAKDYDERGLLTTHAEPAGETTTYTYNANGLPVVVLDASGKTTSNQYDGNNRLSQTAVGTEQVDYYYHPLGGVEKYQFSDGDELYYDYYSTGLASQRAVESYDVDFAYDTLGNRTQVTDPFGLAANYQYDSLSRITDIDVDNKNFGYEYYGDGMIKAVDYPNGLRSEYTYDNMNRLTTLINKLNGTPISQFSYGYDENSNIISVNENGQTTTYQYDVINRLIGINRPGGEVITYQYDSRGNRTEMLGTDIDIQNFEPGTFTYNSWDEMASFTPTGGNTSTYEYDPEGLRTKKTTSEGSIRYHCDDNGLVIAESNASDQVTAQTIWGHKPLARKINGSYYYYVYNGHGDVIQILDESGNVVNSYQYDEWGNVLSCNEQIANPIRYAGEYYDEESGLYYLRARYYDPVLGRFISKDSYEGSTSNPLSLNLYTFVENNPLTFWDPSGHTRLWIRYAVKELLGSSATVTWDSEDYGAYVTYNGITHFFEANSGDIGENGHFYIESSDIDRYFGGTIYDPVPVDVATTVITGGVAGVAKTVGGKATTGIAKATIGSELSFDLQLFAKNSLKTIGSNKEANKLAQKLGFTGAEDLKEAFVGRAGAKFNIKYDSKTGEIFLESIKTGVQIATGLYKK